MSLKKSYLCVIETTQKRAPTIFEVYPDKFMKTHGEMSDKLTYPDGLLILNEL